VPPNVTLPAQGSGTTQPIVETIDEGVGVQRQVINLSGIGKFGSETALTAGQKTAANSIPVVIASDQSSLAVSLTIAPVQVTPTAATNSSIATGGTAVTVATGPINGGYVVNPADETAQGVALENLYVDPVAAPGSTDGAAHGTTSLLAPGQRYDVPALATGSVLRANAATTGHNFTAVIWALTLSLFAGSAHAQSNAYGNNADTTTVYSTGLSLERSYPYLFNGATFDRWYGDKTNGAFVNVKTSVLPTGAALNSTLVTINATLGSPFQAGGSIGNTTFGATQGTSPWVVGQATASSLNATVVGTGTFAVQAAQAGNWTARMVGNAGAILDGTVGPATAPANMLAVGGLYNSTEIGPTTGQSAALQLDSKGRLRNVVMDAAGNTRGANVNASNQLSVSVDNTATVSGTVTANQGTSPWIVAGGGTAGTAATGVLTIQGIASMTKLLVTPDANSAVNLAQIAGVSTSTGAGVTGTGSQRVGVAQDTTTIAGSAPGTAGSASANVLTIQGVASMTPVQVAQATASSLNATVVGTGTFPVQASQAPSAASTAGVAPVSSASLEANHVIKGSAGNFYSFEATADATLSAAAWWLMVYNATSAPVDGAVTPLKCWGLPAGVVTFTGAFPQGTYFSTGITMGVSTTGCFTKTASAHAYLSGDAQ
jgi:hypothetical protein